MEVEKQSYYYEGVSLAMSIVHGGPAPSFFTEAVFFADLLLYGLNKTCPTVSDVPDMDIWEKVDKVVKLL